MLKREEDIVIYAAGPIADCTDSECMDNRTELKNRWLGTILDPMRRDYRNVESEALMAQKIVTMDKTDISMADVVLANCWKISFGTAMEIPYGFGLGKLVVVILPTDRIKYVSPWITYHSHYVTDSMDDALDFIREYFAS